jgi:hypothetical protein
MKQNVEMVSLSYTGEKQLEYLIQMEKKSASEILELCLDYFYQDYMEFQDKRLKRSE